MVQTDIILDVHTKLCVLLTCIPVESVVMMLYCV